VTFPDIEFIAHADTAMGTLILQRQALVTKPGTMVTEIMIDHALLMSSHVTFSERALSRLALEMHSGDDLQVLVGGLGLGYTAWEALQSPRVARAEVVEFVPAVIGWMEEGLVPLSTVLNEEPRIEIVAGDVFQRLALPPEEAATKFDLILIDVDHSPEYQLGGSSNDAFYTADGLRRAQQHLAPSGVLGVWSYAQSSPFASALAEVFDEVRIEPVTFMNDMISAQSTDWLFLARTREAGAQGRA
jgi:spermidine synthase